MWQLNNSTPFAANHTFLSDRNGVDTYVLCLKATYDIDEDGQCRPALDQVPPDFVPRHVDPSKPSSLLADTDFDFMKPGTDVLVVGSAVNPRPGSYREIDVGFSVGPVRKRLRVVGERVWLHGAVSPVLSAPASFTELPIVWENTFGGADRSDAGGQTDLRNPIGTGMANGIRGIEGLRAPSVFVPGESYTGWNSRPQPASFCAVERHWMPRRQYAGTYDENWIKNRAPLWATDLDDRYFMAAPVDQQCYPHLNGNEEVRVFNMTPSKFLGFRLPLFRPYADVSFDRSARHLKLHVSTVAIFPTERRVSVSWSGSLGCQGYRERIRSIDVWDKPLVRTLSLARSQPA